MAADFVFDDTEGEGPRIGRSHSPAPNARSPTPKCAIDRNSGRPVAFLPPPPSFPATRRLTVQLGVLNKTHCPPASTGGSSSGLRAGHHHFFDRCLAQSQLNLESFAHDAQHSLRSVPG